MSRSPMKAFLQKGIIAFLLATLFTTSIAPPARAWWVFDDFITCVTASKENEAICASAWFGGGIVSTINFLTSLIMGDVPGVTVPLGATPANSALAREFRQQSVIGVADRTILAIYQNPPASTSIAVKDFGRTLGFLPEKAFAQGPGIGFSGLSPLLPIWKVFRNIAYFLLAIVMVVIGFMVMFRQKIDPKTVVTVQNALPRVIVALLLITFSYAIVGILIDVMYLSIVLITSLLIPAGQALVPGDSILGGKKFSEIVSPSLYISADWIQVLQLVFWKGMRTMDDVIAFTGGGAGVLAGVGVTVALLAALNSNFLVAGVSILAVLLVAIMLVFAALRLIFVLLSSYIQIIIALLTAPIQLLAVAIPGSNAFQSWIMNLISNLAVFPVTATLLLIATILSSFEKENLQSVVGASSQPSLWAPPFLTSGYHGMAGLIALGILLSIPTIVNSIKEAFKAKPAVSIGGAAPFVGIASTAGQYGIQYWMGRKQSQEMGKTLAQTLKLGQPGSGQTEGPRPEAGPQGGS